MLAIKEDELEKVALEWLEDVGYETINGEEIEPERPNEERSSFEETILKKYIFSY